MAKNDDTKQWQLLDATLREKLPSSVRLVRTLRGHTREIALMAWSPDGRVLASPSGDSTIKIWDADTGECRNTLKGHKGKVYSVAFNPKSGTLASGGDDGTIRLWNTSTGECFGTAARYAAPIYCLAFDPKGRTLISGTRDGVINLWDSVNNKLLHILNQRDVTSLAVDSAGDKLAVGSDRLIKIWDISSGRCLRTLEGHRTNVFGVPFNPKKNGRLASSSWDTTVMLWDVNEGQLIRTLEGHTAGVGGSAFMPNTEILASKGSQRDDTIRLWLTSTGSCLAVIPELGSLSGYSGLAFHPNQPWLASVGSEPNTRDDSPIVSHTNLRDQVIHIWELDIASLLAQPALPTVTYTSAKVVLVGESNVGKSYLAHRIATGEPPKDGAIKTTHGMKFWPLESERFSSLLAGPTDQRRDVVLWDMGGQDEYRLIHQLFLHDTTVALLLFDPTRGTRDFEEVAMWNKYLEKQLRGRAAVKLLVGAKLDQTSNTIDRKGVERLVKDCSFAGYNETSAITGRGLDELCEAVVNAIDWDDLGKTSRPELFQAIRNEIENRRQKGIVVVLFEDLDRELQTDNESETFSLMAREVATASDAGAGTRALDAVCSQLAQQGIIAYAQTGSGKRALILRIEEVERYAGSLILAARNNPRGVPALEFRAILQESFVLPGISEKERLPRDQEKSVIECTLQLLLEHGICFQHEGLLIFPSLFAPAPKTEDANLTHTVSLYYDFAGAIDNIYASLVAWLVLARDFGRVRLWSDRAEFVMNDGGLCGLRKVSRGGGFAHVDVYFGLVTPDLQRKEFISFVEDHLARNGVDIREHVAIKCVCGYEFAEETLRQRIARGDRDVVCPICEIRHGLTEGVAEARKSDPKITQHTWALRTQIEKQREKVTKQVVQALATSEERKPATTPIRLLHLSDLHFTNDTPVPARLQWLLDDIKQDDGLGFAELDYLVVSGDFTDKGSAAGFEKAYEFVSGLSAEFGLSAERCIFVPGNHDVVDRLDAYARRQDASGLSASDFFQEGQLVMARDIDKYPLRFKPFSDFFFHKFVQRPYSLDYAEQGMAIPFWETGLQFLALNSCWQIDEFHRKRSGLRVEAVANAIKQAQKQENEGRKTGQLALNKPLLRIAIWHHAVAGQEQMKDTDFLGNLQKNGVRLALHGDVHEMQRELVGYRHEKKIHIVGSGSFGARAEDRPETMPRLYNVLEIERDLKSARVHTRCQHKPDGPWGGWYEWPNPSDENTRVAFYDIRW